MLIPALAATAAVTALCQIKSPAQSVALVELYTSQGCSSCPPADNWLSALPASYAADRVVPLALHVGYWDYIGWKDPFARREFNERQRWLAQLNRNRTVYTPGVFVQAREAPHWSDKRAFEAAVRGINAKPAAADIALTVTKLEGSRVEVAAAATTAALAAKEAALFVALTESGLATDVKAGENRGERLRNDHVTRDWSGALPLASSRVVLNAPDTASDRLALVAFVQDRQSGEVLQAVRLPLKSCGQ
ncbi:MAG TPA: DUF1223 domain-containing protein [Burkholderiaceae bacterium]|nr:DUF1223 domain-containing protein [Burkholderiaceae bacterium]